MKRRTLHGYVHVISRTTGVTANSVLPALPAPAAAEVSMAAMLLALLGSASSPASSPVAPPGAGAGADL